ncbi:MAG: hypothetical protein WAU07_01555, partial [Microgenomates group bacterium]
DPDEVSAVLQGASELLHSLQHTSNQWSTHLDVLPLIRNQININAIKDSTEASFGVSIPIENLIASSEGQEVDTWSKAVLKLAAESIFKINNKFHIALGEGGKRVESKMRADYEDSWSGSLDPYFPELIADSKTLMTGVARGEVLPSIQLRLMSTHFEKVMYRLFDDFYQQEGNAISWLGAHRQFLISHFIDGTENSVLPFCRAVKALDAEVGSEFHLTANLQTILYKIEESLYLYDSKLGSKTDLKEILISVKNQLHILAKFGYQVHTGIDLLQNLTPALEYDIESLEEIILEKTGEKIDMMLVLTRRNPVEINRWHSAVLKKLSQQL